MPCRVVDGKHTLLFIIDIGVQMRPITKFRNEDLDS